MELVNQVQELRDDQALSFFKPNPAQQRYIDAVAKPGGFIVIFAAGNSVGKTAATVALIAAIIWPELAPASVFHKGGENWLYGNWQYPKDFRIISTPQELQNGGSIQKEIERWFPKGQYVALKNGKSYFSQYLARDYTINLMSYDMAPEAFEGSTNGLIAFNEPPPQYIFNACVARMRKGGRILFPGTPLMSAAWLMDELVAKADGKRIQLISGDIHDNCRQHSGGILDHDNIEQLIAGYDADEREARASGKFMHLSGRIYKSFDREVHVAKTDLIPPSDGAAFYSAIDPASGRPVAAIFAWVDATGTIHIYDEYPEFDFQSAKDPGLNPQQYAELFKVKEHGRSFTRILDRYFGNQKRALGGLTLKQEFRDAGLACKDSYRVGENLPEVETGIFKVREYLAYDKSRKIDSLNQPKLIISPNCKNTIASFEKWMRDPDTGKPKEEYKDFADCVRYLCMARPSIEQGPDQNWDWKPTRYGIG